MHKHRRQVGRHCKNSLVSVKQIEKRNFPVYQIITVGYSNWVPSEYKTGYYR